MSTTADLMGLGLPPALASRLGNTPQTVAGVGTTQSGAALLTGGSLFALTPTASNTAYLLNSLFSTGRLIQLWNTSASQTALIYPPTGGTINGGAVNASISIPPLSGALVELFNGSGVAAETWGVILGSSGGASQSLAYVQAPITLTSQTAAQPAFVGTGGVLTNGQVALPVGTYEFVGEFNLSAMSASSGGFGFALGTANSAVIGAQSWSGYANKAATLATPAAPQFSWNTTASTGLATASTATVGFFRVEGTFTLTTAGAIIPEISLTVAAAAVVGVGSYFKVIPLGSATVSTVGNWS